MKVHCPDSDRTIKVAECYRSKSSLKCKSCPQFNLSNKSGPKEPKKEKTVNFNKLSNKDRLYALLYSDQYKGELLRICADYDTSSDPKKSEKYDQAIDKLCKKYGLKDIVIPHEIKKLNEERIKKKEDIFEDGFIVKVKPAAIGSLTIERYEMGLQISEDKGPHIKDGKFLTVEINLARSEPDIIAEVKKIIDTYKIYLPDEKSKNKPHSIDPWTVYELHKSRGLIFSEIARELSGIKGQSATYNDELMMYCKRVERAYNKAELIIREVERNAKEKK